MTLTLHFATPIIWPREKDLSITLRTVQFSEPALPFFTLLLAAGKTMGVPCPTSALALSLAGAAAAYFFGMLLFTLAAPNRRMLVAAIAWPLVLGTLAEWIFVQISGMETMFFVGLAVTAIWGAVSGRPILSSIFAALVVLTRYDGWALGMIVLAWNGWSYRRKALPGFLLFAALQIPWIIYALHTFGSYWPQSVAAKEIIHKRSIWGQFLAQMAYFSFGLKGMVGSFLHENLLPFFIVGIVTLVARRSRLLVLLAWGAASVAGFSYAGILLQGWYMIPALLVFSWVAMWGLWTTFDWYIGRFYKAGSMIKGKPSPVFNNLSVPRSAILLQWVFPLAISLLLIAVNLHASLPGRERWPKMRVARENAYFQAAQWVREHGRAGQTVLVGEVGALGWALPDFRVIDSSGINSKLVYKTRLEDAKRIERDHLNLREPDLGTADFVRQVIAETKPEFLVSIEVILHLDTLRNDPNFLRDYSLAQTLNIYPAHPAPVVSIYQRKH